jgi:hypothetical protein
MEVYNNLLEVEEATKLVSIYHINMIRDLICNHNLQDKFGAVLVHKHFNIVDGEFVIEKGDVTSPELNSEAYPAKWCVYKKELIPYEYSKEPTIEIPITLKEEIINKLPPNIPIGIYYNEKDNAPEGLVKFEKNYRS